MSNAKKTLADNFRSKIGEGEGQYKNATVMGTETGIGQKMVDRVIKQETDPKLTSLEFFSSKLKCSLPELLSPEFDVIGASVPADVAAILRRIIALANKRAFDENDLRTLSGTIHLIEKSREAVISTSQSKNRGTGT